MIFELWSCVMRAAVETVASTTLNISFQPYNVTVIAWHVSSNFLVYHLKKDLIYGHTHVYDVRWAIHHTTEELAYQSDTNIIQFAIFIQYH